MPAEMPFKTVAVLSEDGRQSWIGTLHGWRQDDEGGWIADVMATVPAT